MPQIIFKKRTAHLASYTCSTRDVHQYKNTSLYSCINHQEYLFHRTNITIYIQNSFKNSFLQNTSGSSRLQMFFKKGVLKSFANFTGKYLKKRSFFLKNLQAEGLQLYLKKTPTQVFSCGVCETFKNTFFYRAPPVTASVPPVAASVFIF